MTRALFVVIFSLELCYVAGKAISLLLRLVLTGFCVYYV